MADRMYSGAMLLGVKAIRLDIKRGVSNLHLHLIAIKTEATPQDIQVTPV
jgi:hypothetical protein